MRETLEPDPDHPDEFRSEECNRSFGSLSALVRHQQGHRDRDAKIKGTYVEPERNYICPWSVKGCKKRYSSAKGLNNDHIPYCDYNPKKVEISWCPRPKCKYSKQSDYVGFDKPKDLNRHMNRRHNPMDQEESSSSDDADE